MLLLLLLLLLREKMASEQRERKETQQTWTQDRELIGNNALGKETTVLSKVKYR